MKEGEERKEDSRKEMQLCGMRKGRKPIKQVMLSLQATSQMYPLPLDAAQNLWDLSVQSTRCHPKERQQDFALLLSVIDQEQWQNRHALQGLCCFLGLSL